MINIESLLKGTSQKINDSHIDQRFKIWQERIAMAFQIASPATQFKLLECRQMVGLFQCIFYKASNIYPQNVAVSMVKTGLGGYHGNKVSISEIRVRL